MKKTLLQDAKEKITITLDSYHLEIVKNDKRLVNCNLNATKPKTSKPK